MIELFVKQWVRHSDVVRAKFEAAHPADYAEIIKHVVEALNIGQDEYDVPSPLRIHQVDDGDYQGTLVFVIASGGYQPRNYWYVRIQYGSCSACDTLEAIRSYSDDRPTKDEVNQYMTLATHVIQRMKMMDGESV